MNLIYKGLTLLGLSLFAIYLNSDQKETAVQKPDTNYTIEGTIRGLQSGWIYVSHSDTLKEFAKIDSAQVINEKFKFSGNINSPTVCYLGLRPLDKNGKKSGLVFRANFILDKGKLVMNCHKDSIAKLKAYGIPAQDEFEAYRQKTTPIFQASNVLFDKKLNAERKKDTKLVAALLKAMKANQAKITQIIIDHVKQYPSSMVSAIIMQKYLSNPSSQTLQNGYDLLTADVKNSPYGRMLYKKLAASTRTDIGKQAPNFEIPDVSGKMYTVNSFKGKTTLVDFWASWCGPCRAENPNLIKAYQKYKGKGFDIVSISLDDNKTNWLAAVKDDKLPWLQLSDLKASKSEVKQLYGITAIPMNYLLDGNGKIIARNLRGPELEQELAKQLN